MGPLVVITTVKFVAFGPPHKPCTTAGVATTIEVTSAVGMGTIGTSDRSPKVFVTAADTQQKVSGCWGFPICHQDMSAIVAWIGTVLPKISPPTAKNPVAGPKRQLAAADLGVTIGMDEVEVNAVVGTLVGITVVVDTTVEMGTGGVAEGVAPLMGAMNRLKEVGKVGFEVTGTG
jgi:hypothetical protein